MEDEKHQDLLLEFLLAIRNRAALTHVIWVAAHIGDPGNELADMEADLGTRAKDRLWDLETTPISLYSTGTLSFPLLHAATWTPTVDKHVRQFIGANQAEWLRNYLKAKSLDFTLRSGNGSEILGKVLTDTTLPEGAVRDLLQARSFCFPTSSVVSRNHGSMWSTKCKLCWRAVDTYAHRFMQCPELHGAGHTMHDTIAKALLHFLTETLLNQGNIPPRVELHIGKRVDAIWSDCPPELRDFRVVIFEFARCYTIELTELETIGAAKRNQYQGLYYFLRSLYADHE
eukprot:815611-Rhodomonas_salina.1